MKTYNVYDSDGNLVDHGNAFDLSVRFFISPQNVRRAARTGHRIQHEYKVIYDRTLYTRLMDTAARCIDTFGPEMQINISLEEMSELTKAICKYRRCPDDKHKDDIIEEISDVQITLIQLMMIYGTEDDFIKEIDRKISRQEERLNEGT